MLNGKLIRLSYILCKCEPEHVNQAAWGPDLAYLAPPPGDLPELEL